MARTIVGCGVVRRVEIQNFKVFARKMCHLIQNSSFCGGVGVCAMLFDKEYLRITYFNAIS